jgi:hypothetical protein
VRLVARAREQGTRGFVLQKYWRGRLSFTVATKQSCRFPWQPVSMGATAKWRYEASAQSIGPVAVCYMGLFGLAQSPWGSGSGM